MRIDRIDIDGYGSLSGSFTFPREGLGFWAAGNDTGKSRLVRALTDVFYGPSEPSGEIETGWIMIRLSLDDGRPLVIARDLTGDSLQITDAGGQDVSADYRNGDDVVGLGERLFRLDREAFASATSIALDQLRATVGDPVLLGLLRGESEVVRRAAPAPPKPAPAPEPDLEATVVLSDARDSADDLQIVRSEGAGLPWTVGSGEVAAPEDVPPESPGADHPGEATDAAGAADDLSFSLDELDDPTSGPVVRARRLKAGLDVLDGRLQERADRLHELSSRCDDVRGEHDRLTGLAGAVPADVEKLGQLLEVMKRVQDKREKLAGEEAAFRSELEDRGQDTDRLRELDERFRGLDPEHLEFLESFQREETVRRGNQALVRSESRLDESRLETIAEQRRAAAKISYAPLAAAALGLFGSIAIRMFPVLPIPANAFLALGLAGAIAGSALLWRAKRLEEPERARIGAELARKNAQLEEFDAEGERSQTRLTLISVENEVEGPGRMLEQLKEWKDGQEEVRDLDRFHRQGEEVDREIVKIREKLASFQMEEGVGPDPTNFSAEELEALHRDYVRYFEVAEELETAEGAVAETEDHLAALESDRAALRERLVEILTANGIDADRDLEEAIERFARQSDGADPGTLDATGILDRHPGEPGDSSEPDTSWTSAVSARMEAILRRFLPEVREVEVDTRLRPSFLLDPRGSRLAWPDLKKCLSAASLDQVCLSLRLAALEAVAERGERLPVLLDDPLVRCDDSRYDRALDFLVADASSRLQMVLLTAHEVRSRWFLHQFPQHRSRIFSLTEPESAPAPSSETPVSSSPPSA